MAADVWLVGPGGLVLRANGSFGDAWVSSKDQIQRDNETARRPGETARTRRPRNTTLFRVHPWVIVLDLIRAACRARDERARVRAGAAGPLPHGRAHGALARRSRRRAAKFATSKLLTLMKSINLLHLNIQKI